MSFANLSRRVSRVWEGSIQKFHDFVGLIPEDDVLIHKENHDLSNDVGIDIKHLAPLLFHRNLCQTGRENRSRFEPPSRPSRHNRQQQQQEYYRFHLLESYLL